MRRLVMGLCVVALAGCGGGGDGGGGDRLTQAEFTAEGKRICQAGADRTAKLVAEEAQKKEVKAMSDVEQRLHLVKVNQPIVEETMGEIEALKAPEKAEPHVKKLTEGVREVVGILADADDPEELGESTGRLQELAAETRQAAESAGLEACLPENTA